LAVPVSSLLREVLRTSMGLSKKTNNRVDVEEDEDEDNKNESGTGRVLKGLDRGKGKGVG
jgi:hypothetical protein